MKNKQVSLQSGDSWKTPKYFIEELEKEFGKMFDPCPYDHNINLWDGLKISWEKTNFINPPYSRKLKESFILKAIEESKLGKTCIMLLPVSTDTKIFHEHILPNKKEIKFIKGRIKFSGINTKGEFVTNKVGMHGSMLVIF